MKDSKSAVMTIVMIVLIASCIIPRIAINYGYDGDAWRSAKAAEDLWLTGTYIPSRLPGNPLFEYLLAGIVPWAGHIGANFLAFTFYAINTFLFSLLICKHKHRSIATALFALTPILLVHAATNMDYLIGMAFILSSYLLARQGRSVTASLCLALAIGFRLPHAIFAVPLGAALWLANISLTKALFWSGLGIAAGLLSYLPIVAKYGAFTFAMPPTVHEGLEYVLVVGHNSLQLFGPIPTLGLFGLLLVSRRRIWHTRRQSADHFWLVEALAVCLVVVLFMLHPNEPAYLLPLVPFLYLLLVRWLSQKELFVALVLIASFSAITIHIKGGESGHRYLICKPAWGIVVQDYRDRILWNSIRANIVNIKVPDHTVIITGCGPSLTYNNLHLVPANYYDISATLDSSGIHEANNIRRLKGRHVFLVYLLSHKNVALLQKAGFKVYMRVDNVPKLAMSLYNYDPFMSGISRIDWRQPEAFCEQKEAAISLL